LKNKANQVTGLYFRSTITPPLGETEGAKHFYLKDRKGIYPSYPKAETKSLIITESIIDAATLLQIKSIAENYSIISAYGTNGLNDEIKKAIQELKQLQEIIFAFDTDEAGKAAVKKYAEELHTLLPNTEISSVTVPLKDINETAQAHEDETIFTQLINERQFIFSIEKEKIIQPIKTEQAENIINTGVLNANNPDQLIYETAEINITVWGGIEIENLSRLKVSLHIQLKANKYRSFRDDVNLYSHSSTQKLIRSIAETLELSTTIVSSTTADFIEALEKYRLAQREQQLKALVPQAYIMTEAEKQAAQNYLTEKELVKRTLETLSKTGLVGETKNGLLLYFLYLSRFFEEPLHAIIFGKSGSGKTYLQTKISECLPEESVRTTTSLSENTLYYSPKNFWKHIVLLIEDLDGVYNALLPLREFMSKQSITKLTTDKDAKGNNVQKVLTVEGPICVSGATTKENIYEDNANRSFLIYVDEGAEHLNNVMEYQRRSASGNINKTAQEEAKKILRNAQRLIDKNITVINPFAEALRIPDNVFKKLRTNMHYLKLIEIITFYHQHQRPIYKNKDGVRCINTTLEDIYWANYLVKDVLLKKSDELNGTLREFFEDLKNLVQQRKKDNKSFYAKEVREYYRMNPMRVNRYLNDLEMRSYINRTGGNRKTGFEYEITNWKEYEQLKDGINLLDKILEEIKAKEKAKYNSKKLQESEV
jgi:hypothetical protein